jgi:hypothetical protein
MQNFLRHSRSRLKGSVHIIPSTGGVMDYCVKILRKIMLKFRDTVFAKIETGFETGLNCANSLENGSNSNNFKVINAGSGIVIDMIQYSPKQKKSVTTEEYINYKKKNASAEASSLALFLFSKKGKIRFGTRAGLSVNYLTMPFGFPKFHSVFLIFKLQPKKGTHIQKRDKMKTGALKILLALSTFLFLIPGCSKDEPTGPKEAPLISGDYFPTDQSNTWRYSSNALSKDGKSLVTFYMSIGTYSFRRGDFKAILGRIADSTSYASVLGIKDSAGVIYSLGDNPPEGLFPLFKHQYAENEVTRETITVNGITYQTLRRAMSQGKDTLTLWFADSIGLVKEFSRQGISLFNDDFTGQNVTITTELIYHGKYKIVQLPAPYGGGSGLVCFPD